MKGDILIVDDEADIRNLVKGILEDEGYATRLAATSRHVYELISESLPDLLVLDIWLQGSEHDGLEILKTVKQNYPSIPVIMISGHGTIETAVGAIKQGAYDFIEKPFKSDRLLLLIDRALETARLRRENEALRQRTEGPFELIGSSHTMEALQQTLARIAQTNSRVLLTGEPGTGKDIAARAIHKLSKRPSGPFVALNCAIMQPDRLETELFGAMNGTPGVLEQANSGTLFLDEVADMPLETQGKIVRALQEQKFQRVGGSELIETDVRIVASTNRNLQALIEEGRFRQDLYYRLNVVPLNMPSLREHPEDVPELSSFFAESFSRISGLPPCVFSETAIASMQAYDWPGNVRQLRNVIEWTMIMNGGRGDEIGPEELPPEISPMGRREAGNGIGGAREFISLQLREARELFEKDYLQSQIRRFGGNISRTASFVGMERSALHRKMKQLGISDSSRQGDTEAEPIPADEMRRIA